MQFLEILAKKRDGRHLSQSEIEAFVKAYTNDSLPDYQASALLMAIFLNGLDLDETVWLTDAMLHSGTIVDLSDVKGIKVDKHSTGGVGDKTSLIIAPVCASLGVPVPMISGRGLGHTGGTLDKLESIPGFNVNLSLEAYRKMIRDLGCSLIGQTKDIAPADKKLYALRDVTCTVENKSLIFASIMSKKLAEGIDALVLDVKTGSGAFMKSEQDAEELARLMMSIGERMGKRITALITDMNQPLGSHVGNALEVIECIELLNGKAAPEQNDLLELSVMLAAHMILLGGKADKLEQAESMARQAINNGSALSTFKKIVRSQGGDETALEDISKLPVAEKSKLILAEADGYLQAMDALQIGKAAVQLGAGRVKLDSIIDPGAGIIVRKKVADPVKKGEPLLEIRYNCSKKMEMALPYLEKAVSLSDKRRSPLALIKKVISSEA